MNNIRNFVIIAHIDHGKSTLADRFLEITGTVESRQMKEQYLDQLELERERGITIKMAPVRMVYKTQTEVDKTQTATDSELLYKDITYKIRGAVFTVRRQLGLGHKEIIYQKALEIEFGKIGLNFEKEKNIDVFYDKQKVGVYRPDFIVENKILIELKTLSFIGKQEEKQIWNYLRGTFYELALLINFSPTRADIYRIIHNQFREKCSQLSVLSPQESVYILNLIDTPGHPDFSYEVSRALVAVEGAILLVDATQGIQAQTLANFYTAKRAGLKIIGAVNKIDLLRARTNTDYTRTNTEDNSPYKSVSSQYELDIVKELADLIGCTIEEIYKISAKTGEGAKELLEAVVKFVPAPSKASVPSEIQMTRALIFDSFYDEHKGIVASVRVFNGEIKDGDEIYLIATDVNSKIKEIGYFSPKLDKAKKITEGEIGYIITGIKDMEKIKIGDTVLVSTIKYSASSIKNWILSGYEEPKPVVFVSFYPEESDDYDDFKKALQKLKLNDSALKFEPDFNEVLGRGFKGGFLGKLHFEITSERLEKEFKIRTINSFPSVAYKIKKSGEWFTIENPKDLPDDFDEIQEPMIKLEIIAPTIYLGNIFQLKEIFRMDDIQSQNYGEKVLVTAIMPLADLISNFDDKLKSISNGFASFSYKLVAYKESDLRKLEILVAGEQVAGLSRIFPKKKIEFEARKLVEKLKKVLPRQQFSQAVQAVIGSKIIARETVPALKKDVTGYLYGGDRTRKMKLWKKQKKGKKRLGEIGRVRITAETFKKMIQ